ncbi:MAG: ATP-dependent zinc metalloprotease FtsH [Candidatus Absconditabacteria bacterium]
MKKGLIFFGVFAILTTMGLFYLQNANITKDESGKNIVNTYNQPKEITLNDFIQEYKSGTFTKIELSNSTNLEGFKLLETKDTNQGFTNVSIEQRIFDVFKTNKPSDTSLSELGFNLTGDVPINILYTQPSFFESTMKELIPLLIFIIIGLFIFKMLLPKGGNFPFGAQAGKLRTKADVKTNFKDVAGMDEAKNEVKEIVDYLKDPVKYQKVGARIPRGVLLFGPPGSGKTLLARAIAGEADVPFFSASGSEFMEMLVGMGAAKVRDLFKKAQAAAPSIIFIDEIDTIGKKRGGGYTGGHQEQEQTLNQILTEMDGFQKDTKVIVIAATNRPDVLDSALMRPGRFDRKVYVGRPTVEEREQILTIHCEDKKLDSDVDIKIIARRTSGFVGADLANICNEAALKTAREDRSILTMDDFEYALEKIVMGPEKKIKTIKEKERKTIAYHELGHAVTAYYLENADPVEKISIVSRGMALGVTWIMPTEDRYLNSKAQFLDELVTLLGGRACEEIFFGKGEITTGASNDLQKATKIVTDMLMKYGMDEDLGTIMYLDQDQGEWHPFKPFSDDTAKLIDQKVKQYMNEAYKKAKELVSANKDTIDILADVLLIKEYLSKEDFESMMKDPNKSKEILEKNQEKINAKAELDNQKSQKNKKSKKSDKVDKSKKIV